MLKECSCQSDLEDCETTYLRYMGALFKNISSWHLYVIAVWMLNRAQIFLNNIFGVLCSDCLHNIFTGFWHFMHFLQFCRNKYFVFLKRDFNNFRITRTSRSEHCCYGTNKNWIFLTNVKYHVNTQRDITVIWQCPCDSWNPTISWKRHSKQLLNKEFRTPLQPAI